MEPEQSSCGQRQLRHDVQIFPACFPHVQRLYWKLVATLTFVKVSNAEEKNNSSADAGAQPRGASAPFLHPSSRFLLILGLQTVASYSIWLTAARCLVPSARSYLNSGTVEPEVGVRTLQGFTSRDIRAQPKGSGIFFVATWVSFVETRLNDCRRCRAEIMSLTVLRVFQIHGPTLLLTFSKAPLHAHSTRINHTLVGQS